MPMGRSQSMPKVGDLAKHGETGHGEGRWMMGQGFSYFSWTDTRKAKEDMPIKACHGVDIA